MGTDYLNTYRREILAKGGFRVAFPAMRADEKEEASETLRKIKIILVPEQMNLFADVLCKIGHKEKEEIKKLLPDLFLKDPVLCDMSLDLIDKILIEPGNRAQETVCFALPWCALAENMLPHLASVSYRERARRALLRNLTVMTYDESARQSPIDHFLRRVSLPCLTSAPN